MFTSWFRNPRPPPATVNPVIRLACGATATDTSGESIAAPTATSGESMAAPTAISVAPAATIAPFATPTAPPPPAATVKAGGVIPMLAYGAPETWGVHESGSLSSMMHITPLYNQLLEYDPETPDPTDIRGDLAHSWEVSADGLAWTFQLAENARWWDGTPVTAADVVVSLDRMVEEGQPRPRSGLIRPYYASSEAIDAHTVKVNTKFKAAAFIPVLAIDYAKILPKHVLDAGTDMTKLANQLGSGPFMVKKHTRDVSTLYERNPDYFKEGRPYFDGMEYFIVIEHGSVMAAFKTGQVLMCSSRTCNLNAVEYRKLAEDMEGKLTVHWLMTGIQGMMINTQKEPFTDVRVRRALFLAVHRQPIIETLGPGVYTLGTPFPPGLWFGPTVEEAAQMPGYRELNGEKHPDDIAEARRLLSEAGFPDGFKTTISARSVVVYRDIAAILKDQLKEFLNIDSEILIYESAAGYAKYKAGDWALAAQGQGTETFDPDVIINALFRPGGARNYSQYTHPRIEEIFAQISSELDRDKRKALADQLSDFIVNEDSPWVGEYWSASGWVVHNSIQNFHKSFGQVGFKHEHLWQDPDWKAP